MPRSGDEPRNARSPLQLRLVLAIFGVVSGTVGAWLIWLTTAELVLVAASLAVAVVAVVNVAVVLHRIRMGPHYQPGPDVPPYRPVTARGWAGHSATGPSPIGHGAGGQVHEGHGPTGGPWPDHDEVVRPARRIPERTRQRRYLLLMGICLFLIVNAWTWVWLVSVTAAGAMSVVAALIPPVAAITANLGWTAPDDSSDQIR